MQPSRGDNQVGVGRVRRHREDRLAGVQVHGLGADQDERLAVLAERFQHVEQHAPGPVRPGNACRENPDALHPMTVWPSPRHVPGEHL